LICFFVCVSFEAEKAYSEDEKESASFFSKYPAEINGFIDGRYGGRTKKVKDQSDASIAETILRLEIDQYFEWADFKLKSDFLNDFIEKKWRAKLREASFSFSPFEFVDIKAGRQTLTWGTGDLLFINDLFPKDWESLFIGRESEYLKKPSDSLKISLFFESFDFDFIYTPLFGGSEYIDGTRLSLWNPQAGKITGRGNVLRERPRDDYPDDSEYSLRLSKNIGGKEFALYAYYGFWQTPEGIDPKTSMLFYPSLSVYGASLRGGIFGGIGSLEAGYYDSREDRDNDMKPFVRNSEFRFLAGFEREIIKDFALSVQHYMEYVLDFDESDSAAGSVQRDEMRHVLTLRVTLNLMNRNLVFSWFNYYSPTDNDGYILPEVLYKVSDNFSVEVGCNIFFGQKDYTFFGAFKENSNVFVAVRFNF